MRERRGEEEGGRREECQQGEERKVMRDVDSFLLIPSLSSPFTAFLLTYLKTFNIFRYLFRFVFFSLSLVI